VAAVSNIYARTLAALGVAAAAFIWIFPLPVISSIVVIGAFAAAALGYIYYRLRAALPLLQGEFKVEGLSFPVRIDRDAAGVPIVSGATRTDVAFGLGFLHAQERFFQMDLCRRAAAGELSELFGKSSLVRDRNARIHQFRRRAERIVASIKGDQRELLLSYSAGVTTGMRALRRPPFEYMLLRSRPVEWRPEDTLLVVFYMFQVLQDHRADQDYNLYLLYDALPKSVADFLTPVGSPEWDAPLVGGPSTPVDIPRPEVLDFRRLRPGRAIHNSGKPLQVRGSNAWAVSATVSGTGHAIIANDIHLGFSMPPVFYRATLQVTEPADACHLSGVTVPGLPFLVAGTNGEVAWGVANAEIDSVDLIRLDQSGLPANSYRAIDGIAEIPTAKEVIHVRGHADDILDVHTTPWGPVTRKTSAGVQFAQWWTAYCTDSANLAWNKLEMAKSVGAAMEAANRVGVPTLGMVLADRHGDVGWTLAGPLPRRPQNKGKLPPVSSQIGGSWDERLSPSSYPRLASPKFDRVWSANAKPLVGGEYDQLLGNGYFALGSRALQIRDRLACTKTADERAMLAIQLENYALFLSRWRKLLIEVLGSAHVSESSRHSEMRSILECWDGRAAADSAAYRLLRRFRDVVERLVFEPFVSIVRDKHGEFALDCTTDQLEAPLWRLIIERPRHLLAPWFASWDDLLMAAVAEVLAGIPKTASLGSYIWGEENRLAMRHPLSEFVPWLGRLLDPPSTPLNGDVAMPLVQNARHGPVVRFAITPGQEHRAFLQMPGGQAGNPLTPYYLAGHSAWLEGRPEPLLVGRICYSLTLSP
jgi:penicillin G amidase